jgi:hypothetical protein
LLEIKPKKLQPIREVTLLSQIQSKYLTTLAEMPVGDEEFFVRREEPPLKSEDKGLEPQEHFVVLREPEQELKLRSVDARLPQPRPRP